MNDWDATDYAAKDNVLRVVRLEAEALFGMAEATDAWTAATACPRWEVRDVVGHLIDVTESYFTGFHGAATGQDVAEPLGLKVMRDRLDEGAKGHRELAQGEAMERLRADLDKMMELCAALGHMVFVTAGSPEKCAACEKLGAQRAIDYRSEDFVGAIEQSTGGRGVDVILDMVGGDYIERNFRALSRGGRLVNIAFQKGMTAEVNFGPMMMKRLTFMATMLRARPGEEKGRIRDALRAEVWPLIDAGRVRPVIDRIFPLDQAQAAHERMAASLHIGKILLAL